MDSSAVLGNLFGYLGILWNSIEIFGTLDGFF